MQGSVTAGRWLRRFHPAPQAKVRLVCCPHAGGAASAYFPASAGLGPDIEVLAVQYPGRQDRMREPLLDTAQELADGVVEALRAVGEDATADAVPRLAFFGHSLGASVAYEAARRVEAAGGAPAVLFASGRRSPSTPHAGRNHLLGDDELVDMVAALGGSDPRVFEHEELVRAILPSLRSDYKAADTYSWVPGPRLRCPVHVLVGDQDSRVTEGHAAAWAELTDGGCEVHRFPGGHFYLNEVLGDVLELIRRVCLP
jgi:surfactin synthase thioesterase subunit